MGNFTSTPQAPGAEVLLLLLMNRSPRLFFPNILSFFFLFQQSQQPRGSVSGPSGGTPSSGFPSQSSTPVPTGSMPFSVSGVNNGKPIPNGRFRIPSSTPRTDSPMFGSPLSTPVPSHFNMSKDPLSPIPFLGSSLSISQFDEKLDWIGLDTIGIGLNPQVLS